MRILSITDDVRVSPTCASLSLHKYTYWIQHIKKRGVSVERILTMECVMIYMVLPSVTGPAVLPLYWVACVAE